jgi:hypothetical protein
MRFSTPIRSTIISHFRQTLPDFVEISRELLPALRIRKINEHYALIFNLSWRSLYSFCPEKNDKINEFLKENKSGAPIDNFYLRKPTQFLGTIVN